MSAPPVARPDVDMVGGRPVDPSAPLLEVRDLAVEFRTPTGVVNAVNGLSYSLQPRETVAILGESGSGKSVSAQAVMGILDTPPGFITAGEVLFRGVDVLQLSENERRKMRGPRLAMIFQDALTSLNPVFSVGWQIGEMFRKHRGMKKPEAKERAIDLLDLVGIPSARQRINSYPHEFSGGMRQRVMIAMALALDPEVLIADEPTTALDVTVQAQVMTLLADLQKQFNMGLILITHDLGVVADVADRVVVMYAGREVETAGVFELYAKPLHPYTDGLMHSIPRADDRGQRLNPIVGQPPDLSNIPSGCPFHPRCPFVTEECTVDEPELREIRPGRLTACHHAEELLNR